MSETILCSATLAADVYDVDAGQFISFLDATAGAGFDGVSLWGLHHDMAVADGMSSDEVIAAHAERNLTMPVIEALIGWATDDLDVVDAAVIPTLDLGQKVGARFVNTVTLEPELPSLERAAVGLARVCDLAAERGIAVSVEFLPWSGIPDLATAARLFDATDRDNVGLMLDTWHWFRQPGGPDEQTLRSLPAERIHVLQINDAPAEAADDMMTETMTQRLLPGHGDIDIAGLLAVLADMGADPVVAPEVFSTELVALGPAAMAARIAEATTAAMAGS